MPSSCYRYSCLQHVSRQDSRTSSAKVAAAVASRCSPIVLEIMKDRKPPTTHAAMREGSGYISADLTSCCACLAVEVDPFWAGVQRTCKWYATLSFGMRLDTRMAVLLD